MKKITRRSFLAAMAAVSAAGVLTACGGSGMQLLPLPLLNPPLFPAKQSLLRLLPMRPVPIPS